MIDARVLTITQRFKGDRHRGVDIRSVNFTTWRDLNVIAPETCIVTRKGQDGYGNFFVIVKPLEHQEFNELKFIHVSDPEDIEIGRTLDKGDIIGKAIIGGNSSSKHLHFEVWQGGSVVNPIFYFITLGKKYRFKEGA